MKPVTEEYLTLPKSIPVLPDNTDRRWAGSGAQRYADLLEEQYAIPKTSITKDVLPEARDLLSLALPRINAGELQAAELAMPVYLRNKVAQTTAERESAKRAKAP